MGIRNNPIEDPFAFRYEPIEIEGFDFLGEPVEIEENELAVMALEPPEILAPPPSPLPAPLPRVQREVFPHPSLKRV